MQSLKIPSPPRTIMEVYQMLPEGTLAEIINETLYMSPAPTSHHQRIIRKLALGISQYVDRNQLGEIFFAPFDVYLDEKANVVQPDIVFISKIKSETIQLNGVHGVPDLLIEILSPGNSSHDTKTKKDLYEKFGVKEYWIVDPETKEATGLALQGKKYRQIGFYTGKIQSELLNETFQF